MGRRERERVESRGESGLVRVSGDEWGRKEEEGRGEEWAAGEGRRGRKERGGEKRRGEERGEDIIKDYGNDCVRVMTVYCVDEPVQWKC